MCTAHPDRLHHRPPCPPHRAPWQQGSGGPPGCSRPRGGSSSSCRETAPGERMAGDSASPRFQDVDGRVRTGQRTRGGARFCPASLGGLTAVRACRPPPRRQLRGGRAFPSPGLGCQSEGGEKDSPGPGPHHPTVYHGAGEVLLSFESLPLAGRRRHSAPSPTPAGWVRSQRSLQALSRARPPLPATRAPGGQLDRQGHGASRGCHQRTKFLYDT